MSSVSVVVIRVQKWWRGVALPVVCWACLAVVSSTAAARQATAAGLSSEELRDRLVHMCKQAMVGIGAMINHCEGILRSTE